MSAINIVIPSQPGSTLGIAVILQLIRDYPDNLIQILHLYQKTEEGRSTFIAFFREPNSISQITAVLNIWGTSFGYNGEGPRGYGAIRSVIEELNLPFEQCEWSDFLGDADKKSLFGSNKDWSDDWSSLPEYLKKWEQLLVERCYFSFYGSLPNEMYSWEHFNENWKNRLKLSQERRNT